MDSTIRNVSELERALSALSTSNDQNLPQDTKVPINQLSSIPQQKQGISSSGKSKSNTGNNSTAGLLLNLSGIQTTTNTKLESLTDAILRLDNSIQTMISKQDKQIELLATIARNTVHKQPSSPAEFSGTPSSKGSQMSIKDYGFTSCIDVMSELIMKLIQIVELQVNDKGKRYRSSRDLTTSIMNQAVKAVSNCEFRIDNEVHEPLNIPGTKNTAAVYIASRLGTINGITPMMTATSLRELFQDGECRTFITLMDDVINRLRIVHHIIPYYEADILCAIESPYFNKHNEVICNWEKIQIRNETAEESTIMTAPVQKRVKIASLLAKRVSAKNAIAAYLKEK